jgi:hypothetical protein
MAKKPVTPTQKDPAKKKKRAVPGKKAAGKSC